MSHAASVDTNQQGRKLSAAEKKLHDQALREMSHAISVETRPYTNVRLRAACHEEFPGSSLCSDIAHLDCTKTEEFANCVDDYITTKTPAAQAELIQRCLRENCGKTLVK
jgi:hypothetical protein